MSANVLGTVAKMGLVTLGLAAASAAFGTQAANQTPAGQAAGGPVKAPIAPAAAPATAGATGSVDEATVKKGRELFANWSCNSCHSFADANAQGHVGPALDGNSNLSVSFVKDRVTNGQGAMPAFGGQMTDEEIDTIAKYIVGKSAK